MDVTGCSLLLYALSQHIGAQNQFNERHHSYGVECDTFSAGYYHNSESRDTVWAAKRWTYGRPFVEVGAVAGYKEFPVLPFVRVGYSFKYVELFAIPAYETYDERKKAIGVVGVQFKVPIK